MSKLWLFKQIKILSLILGVAFAGPFLLGRLGFWENGFSSLPQFQKPNPQIGYPSHPVSYADAIAKATPAVVSINSTKTIQRSIHPLMQDPAFRYFFGDPRGGLQGPPETQSGIGSGVIVTKDGYILTNNHVIHDAQDITVKLSDGRSAKASVVGTDPDTDVAILKIKLSQLPVIPMGDSDKLRVGDVVFAIGNPFGMAQTVTKGIVSGTQRSDLGINTFENFIQTDAAINPGNSGGALIDANGNLIAINNAIYTRTGGHQGIGFAIPISLAKEVMSQLISHGHVTRGWLGIVASDLTDEARQSLKYPKGNGALVGGVIRGGPAHTSGLRPGDIIVNLNHKAITNRNELLTTTAQLKPQTPYPISVVRQGETLDLRVVAGTRKPEKAPTIVE